MAPAAPLALDVLRKVAVTIALHDRPAAVRAIPKPLLGERVRLHQRGKQVVQHRAWLDPRDLRDDLIVDHAVAIALKQRRHDALKSVDGCGAVNLVGPQSLEACQ